MIVSGWVIVVVLLVAVIGFGIVYFISNRKWGYTKKREKELENINLPERKSKRYFRLWRIQSHGYVRPCMGTYFLCTCL